MPELNDLTQAIVDGKRKEAVDLTRQALDAGADPSDVLDALIAGMEKIGAMWKANEVFVPEVLVAARAMKESMQILEPLLAEGGVKASATAIIGTVKGDLHDIGKNLVAMMWKGANIDVIDLGTNVDPEKFVTAAKESGAKVIGLSALLTTTMPAMKEALDTIRKAAELNGIKVIVGGAPITQSYADEIGADAYAPDAVTAVDRVKELVSVPA
ncbi:MAG: corrinoid protein [Phycisphaeraceae bacterium]